MKTKSKVIKINRSEEEILNNVRGEEREFAKIKTRLDKKAFQIRRDEWNEQKHNTFTIDKRFGKQNIDYAQYVEWGGLGGVKRKWNNEAERKRVSRLKNKIKQGANLQQKDQQMITKYAINVKQLVSGKTGRPREYYADRPASNTERTRKRRLKLKDNEN